jgi:hypothetical protein
MRGRDGDAERRWQVSPAQPLVNTNTIAVNTTRLSTGAVPPRGSNPGINGAANAHSSSGTNSRERSSTTETITTDRDQPRETPYEEDQLANTDVFNRRRSSTMVPPLRA